MAEDYRNTIYCPKLEDLKQKKSCVVELVKKDHPKAIDMHNYISDNDSEYKKEFIKAYNGKCAYCGASLALVPKSSFQIDHFIYQKSPEFAGKNGKISKAASGYIENLVLACSYCNQNKSSFSIPQDEREKLHPDTDEICRTFIRDDIYAIQISDEQSENTVVKDFYIKLKLGNDIHRLDYLLMNMIVLQSKINEGHEMNEKLGQAIELLRSKRNAMI